jgi:signal peptidase II
MKLVQAKLILFAVLVFLSIGCDRVTKDLARQHLAGKATRSYLSDTFRLTYVENPGAAMSFGAGWSPGTKFWVLSVAPAVVLLLVLAFALANASRMSIAQLIGFGLVFSGGAGNLFDRFFNGNLVPDFLNIGISSFRTGIFNVADVCISAGMLMILVFLEIKTCKGRLLPRL